MRQAFLPFCRPSITQAEVDAVTNVLRSGWITTGPRTEEFERAVAEEVGAAHAVALSSATAGMHLILAASGLGPGDEVVTPSLTWVSTVNVITLLGATPVFADVDRDTLMITPDTVRPLVSDKTRWIVPVHFAGAPVDLDPFRSLAEECGVGLFEDAAHALGARYGEERIGARGTSIFSFHPIKNITTAEGGMLCTDDGDLAERVRRLRFHGLGYDAHDRETQGRMPLAEVMEPGLKYNLTDMAAALGLAQLRRLEWMNGRRATLVARYRELLTDIPEILPLEDPPYPHLHARHLFVVRLHGGRFDRNTLMRELRAHNIGTGLHFLAVHTHKYYRERPEFVRTPLPNTEWNSDRILSLPLFPDMGAEDVDRVVGALRAVLVR
jgi:UDP-4-amino-4-deoxy-L-arabinose-oxoglutarate aminotransferase